MRVRWRPSVLTWLIAITVVVGMGAALYPATAQWVSAHNHAQIVRGYHERVQEAEPDASVQLSDAKRYNDALTSGVDVLAGARIPVGTGTTGDSQIDYARTLVADDEGTMARIRFPAADVDLPIYHGTSDATLLRGAGHLEGTHLPIGGTGTRSVITAHRGLANATMFSKLDRVSPGDRFTIEVFGAVLTYEVRETRVIAPNDTDSLRAEVGRDLVTLITCTPLGINSHRIIVTGERVTPTPIEDVLTLGAESEQPGFPWWLVIALAGFGAIGVFVWRAGVSDARTQSVRRDAARREAVRREAALRSTAFEQQQRLPGKS